MPAMHLTRVDLPAPLSPTRAITSPLATWKSTPFSACTAPKLLWTSRSSSSAAAPSLTSTLPLLSSARGRHVVASPPPPLGRPAGAPHAAAPPTCHCRRYWIPYFLQSAAYLPVQICFFVRNPSAITVSLMLAVVTATGFRSTDGVCVPLLSVAPLVVGFSPFASAIASFDAASASSLTAL